jgi:hypothetical protein
VLIRPLSGITHHLSDSASSALRDDPDAQTMRLIGY